MEWQKINSSWRGRLCLKGSFPCITNVEVENGVEVLSNWTHCLNIRWRASAAEVKERFLKGLVQIPAGQEVRCNEWFINAFPMKPLRCPTNFEKLRLYLKKNGYMSVLRQQDEVLMIGDPLVMVERFGYTMPANQGQLCCILLSKDSKQTEGKPHQRCLVERLSPDNVSSAEFHQDVPLSSRLQVSQVMLAFQHRDSTITSDPRASKQLCTRSDKASTHHRAICAKASKLHRASASRTLEQQSSCPRPSEKQISSAHRAAKQLGATVPRSSEHFGTGTASVQLAHIPGVKSIKSPDSQGRYGAFIREQFHAGADGEDRKPHKRSYSSSSSEGGRTSFSERLRNITQTLTGDREQQDGDMLRDSNKDNGEEKVDKCARSESENDYDNYTQKFLKVFKEKSNKGLSLPKRLKEGVPKINVQNTLTKSASDVVGSVAASVYDGGITESMDTQPNLLDKGLSSPKKMKESVPEINVQKNVIQSVAIAKEYVAAVYDGSSSESKDKRPNLFDSLKFRSAVASAAQSLKTKLSHARKHKDKVSSSQTDSDGQSEQKTHSHTHKAKGKSTAARAKEVKGSESDSHCHAKSKHKNSSDSDSARKKAKLVIDHKNMTCDAQNERHQNRTDCTVSGELQLKASLSQPKEHKDSERPIASCSERRTSTHSKNKCEKITTHKKKHKKSSHTKQDPVQSKGHMKSSVSHNNDSEKVFSSMDIGVSKFEVKQMARIPKKSKHSEDINTHSARKKPSIEVESGTSAIPDKKTKIGSKHKDMNSSVTIKRETETSEPFLEVKKEPGCISSQESLMHSSDPPASSETVQSEKLSDLKITSPALSSTETTKSSLPPSILADIEAFRVLKLVSPLKEDMISTPILSPKLNSLVRKVCSPVQVTLERIDLANIVNEKGESMRTGKDKHTHKKLKDSSKSAHKDIRREHQFENKIEKSANKKLEYKTTGKKSNDITINDAKSEHKAVKKNRKVSTDDSSKEQNIQTKVCEVANKDPRTEQMTEKKMDKAATKVSRSKHVIDKSDTNREQLLTDVHEFDNMYTTDVSERGDDLRVLDKMSDSASVQRMILDAVGDGSLGKRKSNSPSVKSREHNTWLSSVLSQGKGDVIPGFGNLDELGHSGFKKSQQKSSRTVIKTSSGLKVCVCGVEVHGVENSENLTITDIVNASLHSTKLCSLLMPERDLLVHRVVGFVLHQPSADTVSIRKILKLEGACKNSGYSIKIFQTISLKEKTNLAIKEQEVDEVTLELMNIISTKAAPSRVLSEDIPGFDNYTGTVGKDILKIDVSQKVKKFSENEMIQSKKVDSKTVPTEKAEQAAVEVLPETKQASKNLPKIGEIVFTEPTKGVAVDVASQGENIASVSDIPKVVHTKCNSKHTIPKTFDVQEMLKENLKSDEKESVSVLKKDIADKQTTDQPSAKSKTDKPETVKKNNSKINEKDDVNSCPITVEVLLSDESSTGPSSSFSKEETAAPNTTLQCKTAAVNAREDFEKPILQAKTKLEKRDSLDGKDNLSSSTQASVASKNKTRHVSGLSLEGSVEKHGRRSGSMDKGSRSSSPLVFSEKSSRSQSPASGKTSGTDKSVPIGKRLENLAAKKVTSEPSRVEKRQSRQYHPYRKDNRPAVSDTPWSFDIAYRDMNELLQNLTENQFLKQGQKRADVSEWKKSNGRRTNWKSKNGAHGRFTGFKFYRARVPRYLPSNLSTSEEDDREEDVIVPEGIPNLEERGRQADLMEQICMGDGDSEDGENFITEDCIYSAEKANEMPERTSLVLLEGLRTTEYSATSIDDTNEASLELALEMGARETTDSQVTDDIPEPAGSSDRQPTKALKQERNTLESNKSDHLKTIANCKKDVNKADTESGQGSCKVKVIVQNDKTGKLDGGSNGERGENKEASKASIKSGLKSESIGSNEPGMANEQGCHDGSTGTYTDKHERVKTPIKQLQRCELPSELNFDKNQALITTTKDITIESSNKAKLVQEKRVFFSSESEECLDWTDEDTALDRVSDTELAKPSLGYKSADTRKRVLMEASGADNFIILDSCGDTDFNMTFQNCLADDESSADETRTDTTTSETPADKSLIEVSRAETHADMTLTETSLAVTDADETLTETSIAETDAVETETFPAETHAVETETSTAETHVVETETSPAVETETFTIETHAVETETSTAETHVVETETSPAVETETSTIETHAVETETSTIETHAVETETSTIETHAIETETSTAEISITKTHSVETETSIAEISIAKTNSVESGIFTAKTHATDTETFSLTAETPVVEIETSLAKTHGVEIETSTETTNVRHNQIIQNVETERSELPLNVNLKQKHYRPAAKTLSSNTSFKRETVQSSEKDTLDSCFVITDTLDQEEELSEVPCHEERTALLLEEAKSNNTKKNNDVNKNDENTFEIYANFDDDASSIDMSEEAMLEQELFSPTKVSPDLNENNRFPISNESNEKKKVSTTKELQKTYSFAKACAAMASTKHDASQKQDSSSDIDVNNEKFNTEPKNPMKENNSIQRSGEQHACVGDLSCTVGQEYIGGFKAALATYEPVERASMSKASWDKKCLKPVVDQILRSQIEIKLEQQKSKEARKISPDEQPKDYSLNKICPDNSKGERKLTDSHTSNASTGVLKSSSTSSSQPSAVPELKVSPSAKITNAAVSLCSGSASRVLSDHHQAYPTEMSKPLFHLSASQKESPCSLTSVSKSLKSPLSGHLAVNDSKEKIRPKEAMIAKTTSACAPQCQQERSLYVNSVSTVTSQFEPGYNPQVFKMVQFFDEVVSQNLASKPSSSRSMASPISQGHSLSRSSHPSSVTSHYQDKHKPSETKFSYLESELAALTEGHGDYQPVPRSCSNSLTDAPSQVEKVGRSSRQRRSRKKSGTQAPSETKKVPRSCSTSATRDQSQIEPVVSYTVSKIPKTPSLSPAASQYPSYSVSGTPSTPSLSPSSLQYPQIYNPTVLGSPYLHQSVSPLAVQCPPSFTSAICGPSFPQSLSPALSSCRKIYPWSVAPVMPPQQYMFSPGFSGSLQSSPNAYPYQNMGSPIPYPGYVQSNFAINSFPNMMTPPPHPSPHQRFPVQGQWPMGSQYGAYNYPPGSQVQQVSPVSNSHSSPEESSFASAYSASHFSYSAMWSVQPTLPTYFPTMKSATSPSSQTTIIADMAGSAKESLKDSSGEREQKDAKKENAMPIPMTRPTLLNRPRNIGEHSNRVSSPTLECSESESMVSTNVNKKTTAEMKDLRVSPKSVKSKCNIPDAELLSNSQQPEKLTNKVCFIKYHKPSTTSKPSDTPLKEQTFSMKSIPDRSGLSPLGPLTHASHKSKSTTVPPPYIEKKVEPDCPKGKMILPESEHRRFERKVIVNAHSNHIDMTAPKKTDDNEIDKNDACGSTLDRKMIADTSMKQITKSLSKHSTKENSRAEGFQDEIDKFYKEITEIISDIKDSIENEHAKPDYEEKRRKDLAESQIDETSVAKHIASTSEKKVSSLKPAQNQPLANTKTDLLCKRISGKVNDYPTEKNINSGFSKEMGEEKSDTSSKEKRVFGTESINNISSDKSLFSKNDHLRASCQLNGLSGSEQATEAKMSQCAQLPFTTAQSECQINTEGGRMSNGSKKFLEQQCTSPHSGISFNTKLVQFYKNIAGIKSNTVDIIKEQADSQNKPFNVSTTGAVNATLEEEFTLNETRHELESVQMSETSIHKRAPSDTQSNTVYAPDAEAVCVSTHVDGDGKLDCSAPGTDKEDKVSKSNASFTTELNEFYKEIGELEAEEHSDNEHNTEVLDADQIKPDKANSNTLLLDPVLNKADQSKNVTSRSDEKWTKDHEKVAEIDNLEARLDKSQQKYHIHMDQTADDACDFKTKGTIPDFDTQEKSVLDVDQQSIYKHEESAPQPIVKMYKEEICKTNDNDCKLKTQNGRDVAEVSGTIKKTKINPLSLIGSVYHSEDSISCDSVNVEEQSALSFAGVFQKQTEHDAEVSDLCEDSVDVDMDKTCVDESVENIIQNCKWSSEMDSAEIITRKSLDRDSPSEKEESDVYEKILHGDKEFKTCENDAFNFTGMVSAETKMGISSMSSFFIGGQSKKQKVDTAKMPETSSSKTVSQENEMRSSSSLPDLLSRGIVCYTPTELSDDQQTSSDTSETVVDYSSCSGRGQSQESELDINHLPSNDVSPFAKRRHRSNISNSEKHNSRSTSRCRSDSSDCSEPTNRKRHRSGNMLSVSGRHRSRFDTKKNRSFSRSPPSDTSSRSSSRSNKSHARSTQSGLSEHFDNKGRREISRGRPSRHRSRSKEEHTRKHSASYGRHESRSTWSTSHFKSRSRTRYTRRYRSRSKESSSRSGSRESHISRHRSKSIDSTITENNKQLPRYRGRHRSKSNESYSRSRSGSSSLSETVKNLSRSKSSKSYERSNPPNSVSRMSAQNNRMCSSTSVPSSVEDTSPRICRTVSSSRFESNNRPVSYSDRSRSRSTEKCDKIREGHSSRSKSSNRYRADASRKTKFSSGNINSENRKQNKSESYYSDSYKSSRGQRSDNNSSGLYTDEKLTSYEVVQRYLYGNISARSRSNESSGSSSSRKPRSVHLSHSRSGSPCLSDKSGSRDLQLLDRPRSRCNSSSSSYTYRSRSGSQNSSPDPKRTGHMFYDSDSNRSERSESPASVEYDPKDILHSDGHFKQLSSTYKRRQYRMGKHDAGVSKEIASDSSTNTWKNSLESVTHADAKSVTHTDAKESSQEGLSEGEIRDSPTTFYSPYRRENIQIFVSPVSSKTGLRSMDAASSKRVVKLAGEEMKGTHSGIGYVRPETGERRIEIVRKVSARVEVIDDTQHNAQRTRNTAAEVDSRKSRRYLMDQDQAVLERWDLPETKVFLQSSVLFNISSDELTELLDGLKLISGTRCAWKLVLTHSQMSQLALMYWNPKCQTLQSDEYRSVVILLAGEDFTNCEDWATRELRYSANTRRVYIVDNAALQGDSQSTRVGLKTCTFVELMKMIRPS